ncbi:MAG TPA: DNA-binding response regulator [Chloroflexus aurantiacus]|jgi:NarL family two-component system response regulator LiaR|uniref:Response regulator receiver n=1 Tax=Chloroflexus aurantiacus (strain ATCC 29366 / DSM 635 / J-10-fl) TaxID=324602 RepID=A9WKI8_CHLAA|nr:MULTISPECIES: response regulator transcription factor [Chloroflexus]ABY36616.1 response regulator receiver [Chloroflexus aurantiacus J-10-fl]RMG50950.1 MAG: DNA-binding response regulator [Chloroflexota bacterium]GIV94516.1 MAG: DNA-binding response regulator [Chloroflexus sp.]HBW68437.1 DNA-binding response regulator [Chloroflexus aurantiacus]
MSPIRVALVDDHSIVRRGLSAYLAAQPDIVVVGEAANGESALQMASTWQADVIVMDVLMPGGIDGIETTRQLKRLIPHTHIIILSGYADDARVIGALRAGAITYIEKESQPEQLLEAIRGAMAGKAVLAPALMQRILEAQTSKAADTLTEREREVLKLVAEGLTNAEIASRLTVSEETVKTHVASILRKLGLAHRTQAAIYALRHGLVS